LASVFHPMKLLLILLVMVVFVSFIWAFGAHREPREDRDNPNHTLLKLSEQLLYAVKSAESTDSLEQVLSSLSVQTLYSGLTNDTARKLFWINLYNAWYQILAIRENKTQPGIFTDKAIRFADILLSLDDIEHGILRKYRWKYSLGYLPQFLPAKHIKLLAVQETDYRIHFALNCGAKSCPPIAFYSYTELDQQLNLAARSFLENETIVHSTKKVVEVTKIMQWFLADFDGKNGIRKILTQYLHQDFSNFTIRFKDYDWSEDLKNFTELTFRQ
jgi:hypothetical protein